VAQFADRYATGRKAMGLSENLKPLDRFVPCGRRHGFMRSGRIMRRFLKQACGLGLDCAAMRRGPAGKLGLNLGGDIKNDRHDVSLPGSRRQGLCFQGTDHSTYVGDACHPNWPAGSSPIWAV
jgi:hypothetical protein